MAKFQHHIFVCENQRPPDAARACCAPRGGAAVRARFKALIKERGLHGIVRANAAGCLDQCERGVTVVVYPEAQWYGGVSESDVGEILDAVQCGRVVERLALADHELTGRRPRPDRE